MAVTLVGCFTFTFAIKTIEATQEQAIWESAHSATPMGPASRGSDAAQGTGQLQGLGSPAKTTWTWVQPLRSTTERGAGVVRYQAGDNGIAVCRRPAPGDGHNSDDPLISRKPRRCGSVWAPWDGVDGTARSSANSTSDDLPDSHAHPGADPEPRKRHVPATVIADATVAGSRLAVHSTSRSSTAWPMGGPRRRGSAGPARRYLRGNRRSTDSDANAHAPEHSSATAAGGPPGHGLRARSDPCRGTRVRRAGPSLDRHRRVLVHRLRQHLRGAHRAGAAPIEVITPAPDPARPALVLRLALRRLHEPGRRVQRLRRDPLPGAPHHPHPPQQLDRGRRTGGSAPDGRMLLGITAPCDHCTPSLAVSRSIISFLPDGSDLQESPRESVPRSGLSSTPERTTCS